MEAGTVTGSSRAASRDRPETQIQLQLQLHLFLYPNEPVTLQENKKTMHDPGTGNLLTNSGTRFQ